MLELRHFLRMFIFLSDVFDVSKDRIQKNIFFVFWLLRVIFTKLCEHIFFICFHKFLVVIDKVAAVSVQLGPLRRLIYDINDDQSDLVSLRTDGRCWRWVSMCLWGGGGDGSVCEG